MMPEWLPQLPFECGLPVQNSVYSGGCTGLALPEKRAVQGTVPDENGKAGMWCNMAPDDNSVF